MRMPDEVYATLSAVVDRFPHTGDDEARRAAMEKAVATLRARHGPRWVWKTEHASLIAPSKDGLGYVPEGVIVHGQPAVMFIWDTINGGSRKLNAAPLISEDPRAAYVLAVPPKDWLAPEGGPPAPVPPPVPPASTELLHALTLALGSLSNELAAVRAEVAALKAKPFPDYEAVLFGQRVTVKPK